LSYCKKGQNKSQRIIHLKYFETIDKTFIIFTIEKLL
jgi:hypothetical protein